MNPHKALARNHAHCEDWDDDSFLGRLHEQWVWDQEEYDNFAEALRAIRAEIGDAPLPRETSWRVARSFSYLFTVLGSHTDPNDAFVIKGMGPDEFHDKREAAYLLFEEFFRAWSG